MSTQKIKFTDIKELKKELTKEYIEPVIVNIEKKIKYHPI